ncbi:hypothetical protein JCM5350_008140 [Sporobolomyces pararoseus]
MSTGATEDEQTSRIDHFSKLPYDVLDPILELAYDGGLPTGPLSKRLLPYYLKYIHQSIYLERGLIFIENFARYLQAVPQMGSLVERLIVNIWTRHAAEVQSRTSLSTPNPFIPLLPLLPVLRHLNVISLKEPLFLIGDALRHHSPALHLRNLRSLAIALRHHSPALHLQNLRSLAIALPENNGLSSLDFMADLRSLSKLRINGFCGDTKTISPPIRYFEGIRALEARGVVGIKKQSMEELIRAFPNLTRFTLSDLGRQDRAPHYLSGLLGSLPINLTGLDIVTTSSSPQTIDPILPKLQSLERLHLSGYIWLNPNSLCGSLLQLRALVLLRLAHGQIDLIQLKAFVTSPHRPPRLRSIILDHDIGIPGSKVASPRGRIVDWNVVKLEYSTEMKDWTLPQWRWAMRTPSLFNYRDLKQLVDLAKEGGVEVSGAGLEALRTVENYFIELNNRSVLYAYYEKDFGPLIKSREEATKCDYLLPEIDIDSFEPELEIVETPLPDKDWFILSLKNKEQATVVQEEA